MSQQDAPELFRYFLEALIKGEEKIYKAEHGEDKEPTPYKKIVTETQKIFNGYLVNHVYCLHCGHKSWTFDLFSDLMVSIDKDSKDNEGTKNLEVNTGFLGFGKDKYADDKLWAQKALMEFDQDLANSKIDEKGYIALTGEDFREDPVPDFDKKSNQKIYLPTKKPEKLKNSSIHLQNLIKRFFSRELLNNIDNYYTCEICRKKKDFKDKMNFITRQFYLYNPGDTIVISLKRFRQNQSRWSFGGFKKIDTSVDFEFTIDLTPYVLSKIYY